MTRAHAVWLVLTRVHLHRNAGQCLPAHVLADADHGHDGARTVPNSLAAPGQLPPPQGGAAAELVTAATKALTDGDFAACLVLIAAANRLQDQRPAEALQHMALICRIHAYAADGAWHKVWQLAVLRYVEFTCAKRHVPCLSRIVLVLACVHTSAAGTGVLGLRYIAGAGSSAGRG